MSTGASMLTLTRTELEIEPCMWGALPSRKAVAGWLLAHGIDPNEVAITEPIVRRRRSIEFTRFLRDRRGRIYPDPMNPREPATRRTAAVLDRRPASWPIALVADAKRWGA